MTTEKEKIELFELLKRAIDILKADVAFGEWDHTNEMIPCAICALIKEFDDKYNQK